MRHTATVHFDDLQKVNSDLQKVNPNLQKVNLDLQKVNPDLQKVNLNLESNNPNTCLVCNKTFSNRYTLQRHMRNNSCCHGLTCPKCNKVFSSHPSKSRHMKTCNTLTVVEDDVSPIPAQNVTNNVTNNNIIQNQTNIQNNTYILNFPKGVEDDKFAFLRDHITMGKFEQLMGNNKPAIGFSRYAGAIMQRPENRMIYKKNPNTKHCKVHNEDMWEYVLDEDAFPVLTFHMSCAALEDTHNYKKMTKRPRIDIASLLMYLDDVNTENDENPNYKHALERLKLNIINLSQQHKIPTESSDTL